MTHAPTEMEMQVLRAIAPLLEKVMNIGEPVKVIDIARAAIQGLKLDRQDHPVLNTFYTASVADWNRAIDIASPPT